jgi:hypothetical protein
MTCRSQWFNGAALASVLAMSGACGGPAEAPESAVESVPPHHTSAVLSVAGRSSEFVTLAAAGDFVVAVWAASAAEAGTDVYTAVSRDAGATFDTPVRVNDRPGDAKVNGEQPPQVAVVAGGAEDPRIHVVWTAPGSTGIRLAAAESSDSGRSYSAGETLAGSDEAGNRGWQAIGADPSGRVQVVWLDHRRYDASAATHGHHHSAGPDSSGAMDTVALAQLSDLYFSDLDAASPRAVTSGVCYCCKTAMAHGAAGEVYLAWRHVYAGNMRDIAFAVSRDAGRTFEPPVRISEDGWSIAGCPDDGPAMAVDRAGHAHVVWPTMAAADRDTVKTLFHAMSPDGRTFTARTPLPTEATAFHPRAAFAPDDALVVAWDESTEDGRQVVIARAEAAGSEPLAFERVLDGTPGAYPVLATAGSRLLAAWSTEVDGRSVIQVQSVP